MGKDNDFSAAIRGAVIAPAGKTRITIMLDDEVIAFFRAKAESEGGGYQTLINAQLRQAMQAPIPGNSKERPLTIASLRRVLREEIAHLRHGETAA